jgi:Cu2+-exporting ATPase
VSKKREDEPAAVSDNNAKTVIDGEAKINEGEAEINESEDNIMTKVIKVDGMMCPHCEAHVKRAVMKIEGVIDAIPSHKDGTLTLTLNDGADIDEIVKAVIEAGYNAEA